MNKHNQERDQIIKTLVSVREIWSDRDNCMMVVKYQKDVMSIHRLILNMFPDMIKSKCYLLAKNIAYHMAKYNI